MLTLSSDTSSSVNYTFSALKDENGESLNVEVTFTRTSNTVNGITTYYLQGTYPQYIRRTKTETESVIANLR